MLSTLAWESEAATLVRIYQKGKTTPIQYPTSELDSILFISDSTIHIFYTGEKNPNFKYSTYKIDSISFKEGYLAKAVAHRGFWDTPTSAENSRRSLLKADSIGCYASEFDVWITKDGKVVVHHDASIDEINIEQNTYEKIKNIGIGNGEVIPTLDDYLKTAKALNIHLFCEIKNHSNKEDEDRCTDSTLLKIKQYGLEERTTFISFSLNVCKRVKATSANNEIYYLNGELAPQAIAALNLSGMDYEQIYKLSRHVDWIKECHKLGLKVGIWTINEDTDMDTWIEKNVDFITTNNPVSLLKILAEKDKL